ncbi:MAG: MoxR family ATPase [Dehalococcoidia bacterium]|nr:MoxR family ATPase [Dehalococcoidia bacterium]
MSNELFSVPQRIMDAISEVIIGKDDIKELLLVTLLSGGHLLIEGLPGTGKTSIAKTFARAISGEFKRIQFTPDMLPSDITGFYMHSPDGSSKFVAGPIFANVVLADELNRATPRTQSALLEGMQENQVSIEGTTHRLAAPLMVIASQVPYGGAGTYPLTEVQADRFLLRAWSGHPSEEEEKSIVSKIDLIEERESSPVEQVTGHEEISQLRQAVRGIYLSEKVRDYIIALTWHIRRNPDVLEGPSPRAGIALYKASRALALLRQRDFVTPDDVKNLFVPALWHRVMVKPEAEMEEVKPVDIIEKALSEVPVPKEP